MRVDPANTALECKSSIRIALAQLAVSDADPAANFALHRRAVVTAAAQDADLVLFPELSLTGYDLERSQSLAVDTSSCWQAELSNFAMEYQLLVISGAPLVSQLAKPSIGALISWPDGRTDLYRKQYLHPGEERYVTAGSEQGVFDYCGYRIALAICADSAHPDHATGAESAGAELYLASVLVSPAGLAADSARLVQIAREHQLQVLMANHCGMTGGWQGAGGSAVWSEQGELFAQLKSDPALLLVDIEGRALVRAQVVDLG